MVLVFLAAVEEDSVITLKPSDSKVSAFSKENEERVNHHLLTTNRKMEFEKAKRRNENYLTSPRVGDSALNQSQNYYQPKGVVMDSDRRESQRVQDGKRSQGPENYLSPANQVQREIAVQNSEEYYRRQAQEDYARQFVENAKKDGWAVELDENYVVKSVKRIKPDTNPRLFGAGSR